MRLGRLYVLRPHRARHWWEGFSVEWCVQEFPPAWHFLRVHVQLAGRREKDRHGQTAADPLRLRPPTT